MTEEKAHDDRRAFLASAAKFSAVASVLGLSGAVLAGPTKAADKNQLRVLLRNAIETGDMKTAIAAHGKTAALTDLQTKALYSLTSQDLANLKKIKSKLAPFGDLRAVLRLEL